MKQEIMEKLFNEEPLTNEQILFINNNLNDVVVTKTGKTRKKKLDIPFNHKADSITEACGLNDVDFDSINQVIKAEITDKDLPKQSQLIEAWERIATMNPKNLRMVMYQYVKTRQKLEMKSAENDAGPLAGLMGGITGGDGSTTFTGRVGNVDDLKKFLDFLKKQSRGGE